MRRLHDEPARHGPVSGAQARNSPQCSQHAVRRRAFSGGVRAPQRRCLQVLLLVLARLLRAVFSHAVLRPTRCFAGR